ncbi:hypothetical protein CFC21_036510 [Triticum aestivum]|uniref:BHLH domain-containing protein n=2 Tax=Triticum aestivum TaxID=4565 RepID=A0A3B6EKR3_WHEAT|nr:transcription factor BHLH148-like [Triticum aestivum]KAF7024111.1 hypothetical protein CFC21_036510 [Triticum aestivum]
MDEWFFSVDRDDDDGLMSLMGLLSPPPAVAHQGSAFAPYQRRSTATSSLASPGRRQRARGRANVHRSMHEYLRPRRINGLESSPQGTSSGARAAPPAKEPIEPQVPRSSAFRHITRERLRRERLSQGYADIRALLPPGRAPNGAKNFVLAAAVDYIRELEGRKGRLGARNAELVRSSESDGASRGGVVVKVRGEGVCSSMAGVLEAVLRRLKAMHELRVTAIRSWCCDGAMCMDVAVAVESTS